MKYVRDVHEQEIKPNHGTEGRAGFPDFRQIGAGAAS